MWEILGYLVFIGGLLIWGAAAVLGMAAIGVYAPTFGKVVLYILGTCVTISAIVNIAAEWRIWRYFKKAK